MKPGTVILAATFVFCIILMIQPSAARTINAGEADSGRVVAASPGDIITITLPENPSTGYAWDMTATSGLHLISDTFQRPTTKLIGTGGTHIWRYQVAGTGAQSVTARYHRPWVAASQTDKKFSLSVQVDPRTAEKASGACPYGICKQGYTGYNPVIKKEPFFF
jgi:inhibitor of cysteine peptidase